MRTWLGGGGCLEFILRVARLLATGRGAAVWRPLVLNEQRAGKEEGLFFIVFSFPVPSWKAGPLPSLARPGSMARWGNAMGRLGPALGGPEAQVC